MKRTNQVILIASFIPLCWFAFLAIHELGHVLAAIVSGGSVTKVVLYPLTISRTDVAPNPHPSLVVWSGPVFGALFPVIVWAVFWKLKIPGDYLLRFFAGFCLIGNGSYIAFGSFDQVGDSAEMLKKGSSIWLLWLFGILTIPFGFWLWHRHGNRFGLGDAKGEVESWAAYTCLIVLVLWLGLSFSLSPQF